MARGNVLSALAAAKDLPQLSLADALELTVLVARKDPWRHPRVAARWLLRLLEEQPDDRGGRPWSPPASSRSRAARIRRRRRRCAPGPKERLAGGPVRPRGCRCLRNDPRQREQGLPLSKSLGLQTRHRLGRSIAAHGGSVQLLGLTMLETLLVWVDRSGLDENWIDQLLAPTGLPSYRCRPSLGRALPGSDRALVPSTRGPRPARPRL